MFDISTSRIAQSLIVERDAYFDLLKSNDKDLYTTVVVRNINIFTTSYLLTLDDEEDVVNLEDTKSVYRKFYSTRFNAIRFLLETYLTTLKLFSIKPEDKDEFVTSLALTEKILGHMDAKDLYEIDNSNIDFKKALQDNDISYKKFIKLYNYKKINNLAPDSIDDFFDKNHKNPFKRKDTTFKEKFGFEPVPAGKINYGNVIDQSPTKEIIVNHFELLKQENVFVKKLEYSILKNMYSLFSKEAHPTITSIEMFEKYIANKNKKELIINKVHQNETFLKVLGCLMDILCKTERAVEINELKKNYTSMKCY